MSSAHHQRSISALSFNTLPQVVLLNKKQTYRSPKLKKEDTVEVFPAMVFGNSAVALYPVPLLFFHLVLVSRMPSSREVQHSVSFVFI